MRKMRKIFSGLVSSAVLLPAVAFAQINIDNASEAFDNTGNITEFMVTAIKYALFFIGFLAVMAIIAAGIMYVSSGGDKENIDKAKKILIFAIIGLVVALLGYVLVNTIVQIMGSGG